MRNAKKCFEQQVPYQEQLCNRLEAASATHIMTNFTVFVSITIIIFFYLSYNFTYLLPVPQH